MEEQGKLCHFFSCPQKEGEITGRIAMLGGEKLVKSDHTWAMGAAVMERRVVKLCVRR